MNQNQMNYQLSSQELNTINYSLSTIFYQNKDELKTLKDDEETKEILTEMNKEIQSLYSKFTNNSEKL